MIPHQARDAMVDYILDPEHDPLNILGAAIALLRIHGDGEEKRIADAVDYAVSVEIKAIRFMGKVCGHC